MLKKAQEILQKYYGYPTFRGGQAKIITSLLQGRDTLAIMPTGAGKSLCFQIPALLLPGLTLVVSPLISLMKDQVDALNSFGIAATFINSSLSYGVVSDRIYKAKQGHYKLLYIAPERLESEQFQQAIADLPISLLAIDEAHCVSQWGHDFRPSYRMIMPFINTLAKRPVIGAFTATATYDVQQDVTQLLTLRQPNIYITGFDRENLSFTVARGENKQAFILNYVAANRGQSGIIYAATRKEVETLYELLKRKGYAVGKYHAGLTDVERSQSQEAFIYDNIQLMVATNAFGMGIDKSNVRYVIHHNMPKNMEAYYQEAGRAGRDGEPSECILLFSPQDPLLQKYFIEQSTLTAELKSHEFSKLQNMVDYCHTPRCLRKYILEYFGETDTQEECGNCGNCNDDSELTDITIEAQKIFSCIMRMKERYGASLVSDVLKGSKNKKVLQLHFDELSTHGILKEYSLMEIKDLINMLAAEEYLYLTEGEYPIIKLTQKAIAVMKNQLKVYHKIHKRQQILVANNSLFDLLRTLRREIAEREQVPPYIIFADATLKEMSEFYPGDLLALRAIKGVGDAKLERYGADFLAVIQQYASTSDIPLRYGSGSKPATTTKKEEPSHHITLKLYQQGHSLDAIAAERAVKLTTIQEHLLRCATEGHVINWNHIIPAQYEDLIMDKIKELGAGMLKPLKDALPNEIEYPMIRAAICKYTMK